MSRVQWNQPRDVRESQNERFWDGQRMVARIDWYLEPEDVELIREGRKCLNCMEVFRNSDGTSLAWPTVCICGYEVAKYQSRDLGAEYMGEHRVGPRTSDTEEIDRMEYERQSKIWTPGSSVSVPRSVRGS